MEETSKGDDATEDAGTTRGRHPRIYSKIKEADGKAALEIRELYTRICACL